MLKCTLSVTRYKGPCFAQFGEAAVSKALSVKNAHLLVYVIFCANVFCLWSGCVCVGGRYWEAKHEVEKIWFWWWMSGQFWMCASSAVFAVLRSFYSFLLLQLRLAFRQYFISLIAFVLFWFFLGRGARVMGFRLNRNITLCSFTASFDVCYRWGWRPTRRSTLRSILEVLQWDLKPKHKCKRFNPTNSD